MTLKLGLNTVTNKEYHADKEFISSSGLKKLLDDPELFYTENVLGIKEEEEERNSYTEGSYTHSLILEPSKVSEEYAVFPGLRKVGNEFENFKEQNKGKTIISAPQRARCQKNLEAYMNSVTAQSLIRGGHPEFTICGEISGIKLKSRCDYINVDKGYIVDVKTSGFPVFRDSFALTIDKYRYELSAALYCQIAEQFYGRPFDFYFIAIQKPKSLLEPGDCQVFKVSKTTRERGDIMVLEAINILKKCRETGIWAHPKPTYSMEIEEV